MSHTQQVSLILLLLRLTTFDLKSTPKSPWSGREGDTCHTDGRALVSIEGVLCESDEEAVLMG